MRPVPLFGAALLALSLLLAAPRLCRADNFAFTNLPVPFSFSNFGLLYAGASDVDVLRFEMDVTNADRSTTLTRVDFNCDGYVPVIWGGGRALTNFRLIYYPRGLKRPGEIISTNGSATFTDSLTDTGLTVTAGSISLSSSLLLGKRFQGVFALRLDIPTNFVTSFYFTPQLDGVTINENGIDQPVVSSALPLTGDVFRIVQD
jgi:hypothetical protein